MRERAERASRAVRLATAVLMSYGVVSSAARAAEAQPETGWLARASRSIEAKEYEANESSRGLQAPNRRNDFRAYFDGYGARVVDRTAPGNPELARLHLVSIGRRGDRLTVPAGTVSTTARVVEIARSNDLGIEETFENSPAGLRQIVRLLRRPRGSGDLNVFLRVGTATVDAAEEGVLLRAPNGRRLLLKRLPVVDASGTPLSSRLEPAGPSRIRLTIDDRTAAYPLTASLVLNATPALTLERDQASADFGISVAGAGDVNGDGYGDVLVGADAYDAGQSNEGAAFVFLGSAAGTSNSPASTLQLDQADGNFGSSVAGLGDVNGDGYADVIVAARFFDLGESNEGVAVIYQGSASGIALTGTTLLQGNQINAGFGSSVAGAGDVNGDGFADVIVGAQGYDSGQTDEGAAFIFLGGASGIANGGTETASATLQGNQGSAAFGSSVASAGDVNGDGYADVIVGAVLYDSGEADEGAAFIFRGSASGVASAGPAAAFTILQSNQASSSFGNSVAGAGDVNGDGYADVIVGAFRYDAPDIEEGAAFVFLGSSVGVLSSGPAGAARTLEGQSDHARFGVSVAGAGDMNGDGYADVIVGAHTWSAPVQGGLAFVYLGSAAGTQSDPSNIAGAASLLAGPAQSSAEFGICVAGAGDVNGDGYADVIVGAHLFDSGQTDEGAAFLFMGSAIGLADQGGPGTASTTWLAAQADAQLGASLAGIGDVNGDGYADIAIGAPSFDAGEVSEGAVFVFLGSASGIASGGPASAAATLQGNQDDAHFGRAVSAAGDVNGDGYGDILVGAPEFSSGESGEGAAFVFLGSATGIASGGPANAATTLQGNQAGAQLGWSVASAGDIDGDGHGDVLVGAPSYSAGELHEGAAFVYLGSARGIANGDPANAATTLQGNQASAGLGYSVAGVGDVNGDGYADILAGAYAYAAGEALEGAAFLFHGGALGIASGGPGTATATLQGNQANALFGSSVAGAGDVNGDGYADVIVGAFRYNAGATSEGAAFLFMGSISGIASTGPVGAAATLRGGQPGAGFGVSVAGAGDVNGDGYADVLVGAYAYDVGEIDDGAAFLFLGSASGVPSGGPSVAATRLLGNELGGYFGISVAGAGDIDADGYADVLIGASSSHSTQSGEGAAFLYRGNEGRGRPVLVRQLRSGSPTPIQAWGGSAAGDGFDVRMFCYHPDGGGRVKLQVEVCKAGSDFGTVGCLSRVSADWSATTATSGLTLSLHVPGLTPSRLYHWRARTRYAPSSIAAPGITAPPIPAHGPWRRLSGQVVEADFRTEGGFFYTLTPCRLVDTRPGAIAPIGGPVLSSGVERTLPLVNKCGIPLTARSLSVNLTAIAPTGAGQLVAYPLAGAPPLTSNLSFRAGVTRANNSLLLLNAAGQVQLRALVNNPAGADEVHLAIDVNGYFE